MFDYFDAIITINENNCFSFSKIVTNAQIVAKYLMKNITRIHFNLKLN